MRIVALRILSVLLLLAACVVIKEDQKFHDYPILILLTLGPWLYCMSRPGVCPDIVTARQMFVFKVCVALAIMVFVRILFGPELFDNRMEMFSNDGPMGIMHNDGFDIASGINGAWADCYWIGQDLGPYGLKLSVLIHLLLDYKIGNCFAVLILALVVARYFPIWKRNE